MKTILLIFLCLCSLASAASDLPWLGVVLEKAGDEERNAAGLGSSVGLRVSEVNPDGPYAKSLGQSGDLWWKFDGQILISRCQMVVLLRTKKAGEEVTVEFYRQGKSHAMQVVLGARPDEKMYSVVTGSPELSGGARKLLTHREEVARLSSNGHDISLKREEGSLKFEVRKDGKVILSENVDETGINLKATGSWAESYLVLKLTLDQHAAASQSAPRRRVRYVPRNQGFKE